jgi:hypothetical protein
MNKSEFLEKCKQQNFHGECYYAVWDNFLPLQQFGLLKDYMTSQMGWTVSGKINSHDVSNDDFYLASVIYNVENYATQQWSKHNEIDPFINLTSKIHINALMRIKANLYLRSTHNNIHAPHVDYESPHQGALFYVTTCDAPTYMADGTAVEAIENRLLIFNPATPHSSSAPTNVPYRITININYFGAGPKLDYLSYLPNSIPTFKSDNYPNG